MEKYGFVYIWYDSKRKMYYNLNKIKVVCPMCNKEGPYPSMKRWHFDRCKKGKI